MAPEEPSQSGKQPAPEGEALGFAPAPPKPERYNTQFLVANFEKQERRTRMMVAGAAVLIMVAVAIGLIVSHSPEPKPTSTPQGEAMNGLAKEPAKPAAAAASSNPKAPAAGVISPNPKPPAAAHPATAQDMPK